MKIDVLGVNFHNVTLDEALERADALMEREGPHGVVTPNPEFVLRARKDEDFRALLNGADLALPDGIGVVYASRILGRPLKCRVPGIEFADRLCGHMARRGDGLFLLGAKPGVAEKAAAALMAAHPGLTVCGTHDGYFQDSAAVAEEIRRSGADAVFVCLGAPKQERWIADWGEATGARLLVGLGGSLDVFAGEVERAPEGFRRLGLEWFYRLLKEPSRLGRMAKLPLILVYAAAARIAGKGGK